MSRIGNMRDRAIFEKRELIDDGGGGTIEEWVEQFTTWANVATERGRERMEAGRLQEDLGITIRVRCSSDTDEIAADWRVIVDGRTFLLNSVAQPDRRSRFYEITASLQ